MDQSAKVELARRDGVTVRPWMTIAAGATLIVHAILLYCVAWLNLVRVRDGRWTIAVPTAQVILVTWWAVFSRAPRAISVPGVVAMIAVGAFALIPTHYGRDAAARDSMGLSLWFACNAINAASLVAIVRVVFGQKGGPRRPEVSRFQFGIAQMLLWTAALAVALSLVRVCIAVFHWSWAAVAANDVLMIGFMALANSLFPVVVYLSFCSRAQFALPAGLVCGLILCVAWFGKDTCEVALGRDPADILLTVAAETVLLYATLLPLKAAGWPIFAARKKTTTLEAE